MRVRLLKDLVYFVKFSKGSFNSLLFIFSSSLYWPFVCLTYSAPDSISMSAADTGEIRSGRDNCGVLTNRV